EIARQYGVTIVEDDAFGFLAPANRPIQTLAPDVTLYVCSLSKSIAAGLRVGYLVAPSHLVPRLEATIRALNYSFPPLMSEIASRWIQSGQADAFAAIQRDEAHARQALALEILPRLLIGGPPLGQHLWLNLPEPWRREDFVAEARERGVAVTGADAFTVGRASAPHAVRIGLCQPRSRDEVVRGLKALAAVLANPADGLRAIV
ncbi:MAG TPA: aminotransferase class I/II-fold pyridoxal phosphate-dependent enzyme, partial [Azospirillaceae bacterium]|nr:aminotransferase class I/II-fold pyridoxal phosphate-dependent enzyme [Azospirillaceae bacterium]